MIKWIVDGRVPKMQEVRGGIQEVKSVRQIFNPTLFTFTIGDIFTDVYILHRKERIRFSIYYMVPTSKCLDVRDHIFAVVYTTSYVRQIWVGAV